MNEASATTGPAIDMRQFWKTLGERAIGMTIVTSQGETGPSGFVGLSAAHVSADPATMLVSVDRKTSALEPILTSRHFAINYLGKEQEALAQHFAKRDEREQRFQSPDWTVLETGAPVLSTALGVFDCELIQTVELENTVIAIGKVVAWQAKGTGEPLIFFRGAYL